MTTWLNHDILYSTKKRKAGENMDEQELRAAAIQESLNLSKQDAWKVLVFITGLQAGKELQVDGEADQRQTARTG